MAAVAVLYMMARDARNGKTKTREAEANQKGLPRDSTFDTGCDVAALDAVDAEVEKDAASGSMDSYASSHKSASTIQRTDSKSPEENLQHPYSPIATVSPTSSSHNPPESIRTASTDSSSLTDISGNATLDGHAVRVRTKGHALKSGFPYHPGLYDLHVRPDDWQRFSDQLTDSTKFDSGDYAKLWAAVGGLALTGSILTSTWVARTMNRSMQEKKVETGLVDMSPGSLGETLEHWNTSYFAPLGLRAHLELSDSAMRKPNRKSSIIRKPTLLYREREERDRKREDRKFVVVVAELDHTSPPPAKVHELDGDNRMTEMPVPDDPRCYTAELPGDTELRPSELHSPDDNAKEDLADIICGVSEVPGDTPVEMCVKIPGTLQESKSDDSPRTTEGLLRPRPLAS